MKSGQYLKGAANWGGLIPTSPTLQSDADNDAKDHNHDYDGCQNHGYLRALWLINLPVLGLTK